MSIRFFKIIGILCLVLTNSAIVFADQSAPLKSLLIKQSGWTSSTPEGTAMDMGTFKMVNATSIYTNGDKQFEALIIAGNSAMMQGQSQAMNVESNDAKVNISQIDGYHVVQAYDKSDKTGSVVVNLVKHENDGAMFIINFSNISPKDALTISKNFSWEKMKKNALEILK